MWLGVGAWLGLGGVPKKGAGAFGCGRGADGNFMAKSGWRKQVVDTQSLWFVVGSHGCHSWKTSDIEKGEKKGATGSLEPPTCPGKWEYILQLGALLMTAVTLVVMMCPSLRQCLKSLANCLTWPFKSTPLQTKPKHSLRFQVCTTEIRAPSYGPGKKGSVSLKVT